MEYIYTREIQPDGRYNIGYLGEKISLARRIKDIFTNHSVNVKCNNTNVVITMSPDLTTEEKTTLDNTVNTHKSSLDNSISPFMCNGKIEDPTEIDINFHGLYKDEIIDSKGSLIEKNYYKDFDGTTYSNLAIKDKLTYTILPNDLVSHRTETITWYLENGDIGSVKNLNTKYYIIGSNYTEAIKEGIRRRSNLLDKAKTYGLANIQGTHEESGQPSLPNSHYFFNTIIDEVELYISGTNKQALIDTINNSTEPSVTSTIKSGLEDILKYW